MRPKLGCMAIALGLLASPVLAEQPAPRPWTGFWLGAGLGGGAVVQEQSLTISGFGTVFGESSGGQGVLGTVAAGYDIPVTQRWIAGVFLDVDVSGMSSDSSGPFLFSYPFDHKYSWSLGARAGYLATPNVLWYLAAGYSRARFGFDFIGNVDFNGYFVGGGAEVQLGGNWSVRGEYRFSQFQDEIIDSCGCGDQHAEPSIHTGRVVLIYRFGGIPASP